MCRPENGGKKLEEKCQLRSVPCTEGDWTARDTIIHCIQRTGRLAAQKQLLEYLAWKAAYSLHFLWCGFQLHSRAKQHRASSGLGTNCTWFIGHPEGDRDHSTALLPEGPGSCCRISEDGGSARSYQQGGWHDPFSVLAILSQRKPKKGGSSERQQITPALKNAHKIGPRLSELGMSDNNSNSLH